MKFRMIVIMTCTVPWMFTITRKTIKQVLIQMHKFKVQEIWIRILVQMHTLLMNNKTEKTFTNGSNVK